MTNFCKHYMYTSEESVALLGIYVRYVFFVCVVHLSIIKNVVKSTWWRYVSLLK